MNAPRIPSRGQLSLLADGDSGRPERIALDATSWVEHTSRWLADDTDLMAVLVERAGWEQRRRWMYDKFVTEPRLTAEYPILADTPVARLLQIGAALSAQYGVPYDRAWLNLYRDHNDSTSWHFDRPCLRDECIVPVVSLGETRRFQIRPKAGGKSVTFIVRGGDLVVMGGRCQKDWVHSVPKEQVTCGARISINFASAVQDTADGGGASASGEPRAHHRGG